MSASNFTNREWFTVEQHDLDHQWAGLPAAIGFACAFCMTPFQVGDRGRWLYANDAPNCFVCEACHEANGGTVRILAAWHERWRTVIQPILRRWGYAGRG